MAQLITKLTGITFWLQNVSLQDLEDLQADIKVYKDLDKNKTERTFWEDLEVVCEDQIKQNKKKIKVSDHSFYISSVFELALCEVLLFPSGDIKMNLNRYFEIN
jgi:hypothetical protein